MPNELSEAVSLRAVPGDPHWARVATVRAMFRSIGAVWRSSRDPGASPGATYASASWPCQASLRADRSTVELPDSGHWITMQTSLESQLTNTRFVVVFCRGPGANRTGTGSCSSGYRFSEPLRSDYDA